MPTSPHPLERRPTVKKWKEHWREMLSYEKIFEIASYVFFVIFLGTAFYELFFAIGVQSGVLERSFDTMILLNGMFAAFAGCQAVAYWRRKRGSAILYLAIAIIWGLDTIGRIVELLI